MSKIIRFLTVILMSQSLVFISFAHAGQLALPSGDLVAPQITHVPLTEKITAGSSQQIKASVSDNVGVKTVTLFYRTAGSKDYKRIKMNQVGITDEYIATLGIEDTEEPGLEYYIQAVDLAGNALLYGYSFSPLELGIISNGPATGVALGGTLGDSDPTISEPGTKDSQLGKKKTNKWLWIGLGVLGAGIIAAAASSGGDDGPSPPAKTGSVTVNAPVPGN